MIQKLRFSARFGSLLPMLIDAPRPERPAEWLLLIHQLPPTPAYLRVKIWRRLQAIGAVAIKPAVYALPRTEPCQEDFHWLLREIIEGGGEGLICEAGLIDGMTDAEVRALFDAARDAEYEGLAKEVRALSDSLPDDPTAWRDRRGEIQGQVTRLRKRLAQIVAIDFFSASGREAVAGLLGGIEERLRHASGEGSPANRPESIVDTPTGRTWVTRRGVHVDRIACAWLIRRFLDPAAQFKFVAGRTYHPEPGELRFDMVEAEYTHEGDKCSFEVLLERAALRDPALQAIAEIVHDIDLKESKFGREEVTGIKHLIAGLTMAHASDETRLARGAALLDDLYAYFQRRRG